MAKAKAAKAKTGKVGSAAKAVKAKVAKSAKSEAKPKKDADKKAAPKKEISKTLKSGKVAVEKKSSRAAEKISPEPATERLETQEPADISSESEEMGVPSKPKKEPKPKKEKSAKKLAAEKAIADENKKWADYKEKYGSEKAINYSMSGVYEPHQPLQHKVLGWGYIVSIQNDRLEVLFEQGTKMLISNYKTK